MSTVSFVSVNTNDCIDAESSKRLSSIISTAMDDLEKQTRRPHFEVPISTEAPPIPRRSSKRTRLQYVRRGERPEEMYEIESDATGEQEAETGRPSLSIDVGRPSMSIEAAQPSINLEGRPSVSYGGRGNSLNLSSFRFPAPPSTSTSSSLSSELSPRSSPSTSPTTKPIPCRTPVPRWPDTNSRFRELDDEDDASPYPYIGPASSTLSYGKPSPPFPSLNRSSTRNTDIELEEIVPKPPARCRIASEGRRHHRPHHSYHSHHGHHSHPSRDSQGHTQGHSRVSSSNKSSITGTPSLKAPSYSSTASGLTIREQDRWMMTSNLGDVARTELPLWSHAQVHRHGGR